MIMEWMLYKYIIYERDIKYKIKSVCNKKRPSGTKIVLLGLILEMLSKILS